MNRTGLAQSMLSFPCSVFTTNKSDTKRSVIVINRSFDEYLIKRWNISECEYTQSIPSFDEFTVSNVFNETQNIFKEDLILEYQIEKIPLLKNFQFEYDNYHQLEERYKKKFDNYLNSDEHSLKRECWLWKSFLKIYHQDILKIFDNINFEFVLKIGMKDEKFIVETKFPRTWKFWEIWKRQMLNYNSIIPAELVFGNLHKKTFCPSFNY